MHSTFVWVKQNLHKQLYPTLGNVDSVQKCTMCNPALCKSSTAIKATVLSLYSIPRRGIFIYGIFRPVSLSKTLK